MLYFINLEVLSSDGTFNFRRNSQKPPETSSAGHQRGKEESTTGRENSLWFFFSASLFLYFSLFFFFVDPAQKFWYLTWHDEGIVYQLQADSHGDFPPEGTLAPGLAGKLFHWHILKALRQLDSHSPYAKTMKPTLSWAKFRVQI